MRKADWEARLSAWLEACEGKPHAWGKLDCIMLGMGAVRAVTGKDPARGHRGKYRSQLSAYRYLAALGWKSPADAVDAHFERIPPAMAGRGDLVLHAAAIGVCVGRFAVFMGEESGEPGLVRIPFDQWQAAWKVV